MIRFNYHATADNRVRRAMSTIFGRELRLALGVLGGTIVLVAAAWFVETDRLTRLDVEAATLRVQLREAELEDGRVQRLRVALGRLRTIDARIAAVRRHAIASTNLVASIGNHLPGRTWLTNLSLTADGTLSIAGRSGRLAEIGTTLTALRGERSATRLLSVSAAGRTLRTLDFTLSSQERP